MSYKKYEHIRNLGKIIEIIERISD